MKDKISKTRILCIVLTVCMVLCAICIGGYNGLKQEQTTAANVFTYGVNGDGYSIMRDLKRRVESTQNLVTVSTRYIRTDDPLVRNLQHVATKLESDAGIATQYQYNVELTQAVENLWNSLTPMQDTIKLSDWTSLSRIVTELHSANQTISHDGYNAAATAFNQKLDQFPFSVYSGLFGIKKLELFL